MADVKISEYDGPILGSIVAVSDNLWFMQAIGDEYEGSIVTMGHDGLLHLRIIPDQDSHWTDTDNTSIALTSTDVEVLSVTIDQDLLPADGGFSMYFNITDAGGLLGGDTLNIGVYVNGTLYDGYTQDIASGDTEYPVLKSGRLNSTISSGATISVKLSCDNDNLTLNGDITETSIDVYKAAVNVTKTDLEAPVAQGFVAPDIEIARIGDATGEVDINKDGIDFSGNASMETYVAKAETQFPYYMKADGVTASKTIAYTDPSQVVVASTADIILTLPLKSTLTGKPPKRIMLTCIQQNGYTIKVQCGTGDTFHTGHSYFMVPTNRRQVELIMHEHGMAIITSMCYDARYFRDSSWSASNFSSSTAIPFETEDRNTQDEIFDWDSSTKVTVGATGEYRISAGINIDSTGGSTWNCTLTIHKNGSALTHMTARGGNYGGEDDEIVLIPMILDLAANDYIEVFIDQNNLTGNLLDAVLTLEMHV